MLEPQISFATTTLIPVPTPAVRPPRMHRPCTGAPLVIPPSAAPTATPTAPTVAPTSGAPTASPTAAPTAPTVAPTSAPTAAPVVDLFTPGPVGRYCTNVAGVTAHTRQSSGDASLALCKARCITLGRTCRRVKLTLTLTTL